MNESESESERSVAWPCGCGHMNARKGATKGHQVIFDVCDDCGKGPLDMPTFVVVE